MQYSYIGNSTVLTTLIVASIAVAVALLANPVVNFFNYCVRRASDPKWGERYKKKKPYVPSWLLGTFERLLAFTLLFLQVPYSGAMLAGWIGAKLASNWQRRAGEEDNEDGRLVRMNTFVALMGGTVSVAIGAAAGEITRRWLDAVDCWWVSLN